MYIQYTLVGGWITTGGLLLTGDSGTNLKLTTSPCFLPLTRSLEPHYLMPIPEPINLHRSDKIAASIFLSSGFMLSLIMSPLGALRPFYIAPLQHQISSQFNKYGSWSSWIILAKSEAISHYWYVVESFISSLVLEALGVPQFSVIPKITTLYLLSPE